MSENCLYIVTPCSRPKNLFCIGASISRNIKFPVKWIIVLDQKICNDDASKLFVEYNKERLKKLNIDTSFFVNKDSGVVGHGHRNYALDFLQNRSGWVYFNDDDNIISEDFKDINFYDRNCSCIVLSQKNSDGNLRFNGGIALTAEPKNMQTYHIDTAQLIYNISNVRHQRFEQNFYEADGMFAEKFYQKNKNVLFLKDKYCYYNFLEL